MILLHATSGDQIAVRPGDIFVAIRRSAPARTEVSVRMTASEHVMYTVTETPAEIVAMVNSAGAFQ
jgi:hypothetical protein